MPVKISGVEPGSAAERAGLRAGDALIQINGHDIYDVLDYRFYLLEERLEICYLSDGKQKKTVIFKEEYDDPGLCFETYLMDRQRACQNKCVFCFIDQLPKGLRQSLYFKDDDARLSFLFGNYVTLTNMTEREVERILQMHISPINVSVHTTNPALRVKMMKNQRAGEVLTFLPRFAQAGIKLNFQLVLCPGINDGEELTRSLEDLSNLFPAVQSIAAVPVGLTQYREGLTPLTPFDVKSAQDVIDRMERFGDRFMAEHGTRLCYAADEFYLKAQRPIPKSDFYEEFAQLENGVGLYAMLRDEFLELLEQSAPPAAPRRISIATGKLAYPLIQVLVDEAEKKWHNLSVTVHAVSNEFFGPLITVAGLITGKDLIGQLQGKDLGQELLIPACMLRQERDLFLDSVSVEEVEHALGVPVRVVNQDGQALLEALCGIDE